MLHIPREDNNTCLLGSSDSRQKHQRRRKSKGSRNLIIFRKIRPGVTSVTKPRVKQLSQDALLNYFEGGCCQRTERPTNDCHRSDFECGLNCRDAYCGNKSHSYHQGNSDAKTMKPCHLNLWSLSQHVTLLNTCKDSISSEACSSEHTAQTSEETNHGDAFCQHSSFINDCRSCHHCRECVNNHDNRNYLLKEVYLHWIFFANDNGVKVPDALWATPLLRLSRDLCKYLLFYKVPLLLGPHYPTNQARRVTIRRTSTV